MRFQVLFHSPSGVLFAFPSRYWFTIGRQRVFSLGEWSPQIPTGFHVPGGTQERIKSRLDFAYGAGTLYGWPFQDHSAIRRFVTLWLYTGSALQPRRDKSLRFRLFPVRSPLLGESLLISFPPATEMFHFAGLSPYAYLPA